jgi:hypothetical protein
VLRSIQDGIDQEFLKASADDEENCQRHKDRQIRVKTQQVHRPVGGVHAQHDEGPVGKVDHLHDTEDERQPDGHQTVDPAYQQPIQQGSGDKGKSHKLKPRRQETEYRRQ